MTPPTIGLRQRTLLHRNIDMMSWTSLILQLCLAFALFPHHLDAADQIDLRINQLLLRRPPPGCCTNGIHCSPDTLLCPLNFRLCIDALGSATDAVASGECLVAARNFSLIVRAARPLEPGDQTFIVDGPLPAQRVELTMTASGTMNISVHLSVWSGDNSKLLLYSPHYPATLSSTNRLAQSFPYTPFGYILVFQLQASCPDGFMGPECAIRCEPPSDHYMCSAHGLQCKPGWEGPRCMQPRCTQACANGGQCVRPDQCECPRGWTGPKCEQCVPRKGCQNGFCTDDPGKCICLPNWTGPDCNLLVDKCSHLPYPCKNGGRCTTDGIHGDHFRCLCPTGFTGTDCSISYANCRNASCGVHQQCVPLQDSYTCVCMHGYTGPDCMQQQLPVVLVAEQQPKHGGKHHGHGHHVLLVAAPSSGNTTTESDSDNHNNFVAQQHQLQNHADWSAEFASLKALVACCILLGLVVLTILCCGCAGGDMTMNGMLCCPQQQRRNGHNKVVGDNDNNNNSDERPQHGDELSSVSCSSATTGCGNKKLRWGSTSTSRDVEVDDSGLESVHSVSTMASVFHNNNSKDSRHYSLCPMTTVMAPRILDKEDNNQQQQQKREQYLLHHHHQQCMLHAPPPSYDETVLSSSNGYSRRTSSTRPTICREAFV